MNPVVIRMDEMSDSTEVYEERPSPVFAVLIWTLAGILVLALVWMGLFHIDVVTRADGIIRNSRATATITNLTDGNVLSWDAQDGEYVTEGQVIFSVDSSEFKKQEESCAAELENISQRLKILEAYYQELDGGTGALEQQRDNIYYEEFRTKLEAVNISRGILYADADAQQTQYQNSLAGIDSSIADLTDQETKLDRMLSDMRNRTNSFSPDEVYYYTAVQGYIDQYNYTARQYDMQIAELENSQEASDNRDKIAELENQKALALSQLETEAAASAEQSLASIRSNLESLQTTRNETAGNLKGLNNGSLELGTEQIVNNEKNAVNTEINTYEGREREYKETLETIQTRIGECDVKAQADGYLNLSAEKTAGDHVSAGEQIGSIVPEGEGTFQTVIYVENQDIGSVREGQKVRYEVASYPQTGGYGVFEGEVTSVSRDIKVNSETGTGYYEVEATITARGGTDGKEDPEFIQGMAVRARLVTGEKSVLEYLLEKIDLVDE